MSYIQGSLHQNGATASTTVAVTLTNPVGSGHALCVAVAWAGYTSSTDVLHSVTDDQGNTYTPLDFVVDTSGGAYWVVTAYCANVTNAPRTITATIYGGGSSSNPVSYATILVDEFSSIATSSALDVHAINNQDFAAPWTSASLTSGNITTTANGDLIWGVMVNGGGVGTVSNGAGFTAAQAVAGTFFSEYQTQATAGSTAATYSATYGGGASDGFITAVIALKAASGGSNSTSLATTEAKDVAAISVTDGSPAAYYVDSALGNDSNSGLAPGSGNAWRTLGQVNGFSFLPGSTINFKGGQSFAGTLTAKSGVSGAPLTYTSYGTGNATIAPTGADAVAITNVGYVTVENLILTGDGSANFNGVNIEATSAVSNITLNGLSISGFGRAGVLMAAANTTNILSNVTVENCTVNNCTTHVTISNNLTGGILAGVIGSIGTTSSSGGTFGTTLAIDNVLVTGCTVENCPGYAATPSEYQSSTGILLTNIQNSTVSNCYISSNGANEAWGNSGIEYNWATNCVVEFCEVYNQISSSAPSDGDGIDLDTGCNNCTAQYNYVHHCGGNGILFCNFSPYSHDGCIARYNILENNTQSHPFNEICINSFSGGSAPTNIKVYNNTVYNNLSASLDLVQTTVASGGVTGYFANNIIIEGNASNTLQVSFAGSSALITNGNLYYATGHSYSWDWQGTTHTSLASYRSASSQEANSYADVNPLLVNPGSGGTLGGYVPASLTAYRPVGGSPIIDAGLNLASLYSLSVGSADYYGVTIPDGTGHYSIGASQSALEVLIALATTEARDVAAFSYRETASLLTTEALDIAAFALAMLTAPLVVETSDAPGADGQAYYTIGQETKLIFRCSTPEGVPATPAGLSLSIKPPTGAPIIIYGGFTHLSTGIYCYPLLLNAVGLWTYEWNMNGLVYTGQMYVNSPYF
jgi:hypothetical protein